MNKLMIASMIAGTTMLTGFIFAEGDENTAEPKPEAPAACREAEADDGPCGCPMCRHKGPEGFQGPQGQGRHGFGPMMGGCPMMGCGPMGPGCQSMGFGGPRGGEKGPGARGGCPMMQNGERHPGFGGPRCPMAQPEELKAAGATDEQIKTVKAFLNEQEVKAIDLRAAEEKAALTLRQLEQGDADEATLLKAADALAAARSASFHEKVMTRAHVKTLLGKEILEKLHRPAEEKAPVFNGGKPHHGGHGQKGPKGPDAKQNKPAPEAAQ